MTINSLTSQDLVDQFNDYQLVVSEVLGGMDAEMTRIAKGLSNFEKRIAQIEGRLQLPNHSADDAPLDSKHMITQLELAKLLARVDELEKIVRK